MKKFLPIIIGAVVLIGGYFLLSMNYQNSALKLKQDADKTWANVEGSYQRRNDLIGNLVKLLEITTLMF